MSYIGKAPGFGIRNRYYFTATAAQTTFSGADDNGQTLAYADSKYLDVFLNGVLLVAGTDYAATTLTSVTLTSGASASDIIEIVAYDIFSVADTVSAANGGTFSGEVTFDGGLSVDGGTIKLDGNYPVGTNNVALGDGALDSVTSGGSNTAIGSGALTANTTGEQSVAVGYQAGSSNTTNPQQTFVGYQSGLAVTGYGNTAIGYQSLKAATTGYQNAAIGRLTLSSLTTGINNTAIGNNSGDSITTGSSNVILGGYNGNQGGLDIRTSSNNIVLSDGDGTPFAYGGTLTGISANVKWVFGGYSNVLSAGYAETVAIGDSFNSNGYALAIESKSIAVRFVHKSDQTTFDGVVGSIVLDGSSTSYNTSSDYRLKENVVEIPNAIDRIKELKPSRFNFIKDPDTVVDGFLAHEVQDIVPEAITGEKDGVDDEGNPEYQSIDQSKLVPLLTAALKEAITEIETLKERVTALENQ